MINLRLMVLGVFAACAASADTASSLEKIRQASGVPSLGALRKENGTITNFEVVGVRKNGDPTLATPADKFHLGSDTKAMTATLVAMFVQDGQISWQSTLGELFPEMKSMDPSYKAVTIEMLLAHRSGITGDLVHFGDGSLWKRLRAPGVDPVEGRKILVNAMLSQPPQFQPGSTFEYSNQGYAILGAILEKISGKSWELLIQERLFNPLVMSSCGIGALGDPSEQHPQDAIAHLQTANGPEPVYFDNPETIGPAATVHCAMQDWLKFIELHMDAFNGKPRLLNADSFTKLHTSYPGQEYTYGGWIRTARPWADGVVFTHDGSNGLNYASVWWAPRKNMVLMAVSNIGAPSGQKAVQEAIAAVLQ